MSRFFEIIGRGEPRRFSDRDLPLAIGSGDEDGILLPEGGQAVAWLADSRGFLFLQPGDTDQPLFHNDEQLEGSVWIKSGDRTRIGDTVLHWTIAGDRVEVLIQEAQPAATTETPPLQPPAPAAGPGLPRVEVSEPARSPSRVLLGSVLGLVLLLAMAAVLLLTAGRVVLDIRPAPDSLSINGFPPALVLGSTVLALPGRYRLQAEKAGYRPLDTQLDVAAGHVTASFSLEKLPGKLTITSTPSGARVLLDSVPRETTPLGDLAVAAGAHLLQVEKERYQPWSREITVEGKGTTQEIHADLLPGWGTVRLRSQPPGAEVREGEHRLGVTPLDLELMAGTRDLELFKKGYLPAQLSLEVTAMEKVEPEPVVLQPAPARVTLRTTPAGAMVAVNGSLVGTSPVELRLAPEAEQLIRVQKNGYRPVVLKRRFAADSEQGIDLVLEREYGVIFLTTDPATATLTIDGRKQGTATGRLRLPAREHRLTITAEGYEPETLTVLPDPASSRQIDVRLRRKSATPQAKAAAAPAPVQPRSPVPAPAEKKPVPSRFLRIGPATVAMGADRREPGRRANEQQRTVRLERPVLLGIRPVTNAEYRKFFPNHHSGTVAGHSLDGDDQPVVMVSWEDAARYCNRLSKAEGLPAFYRDNGKGLLPAVPANTGYRLPSEAEWAFAARMAGRPAPARYPWPGSFPPHGRSGNFADESARGLVPLVINGYQDGFAVTSPVGSFPKNPGGFLDMGGNIGQWCHDWYTPYMGSEAKSVDPLGPARGTHHVIRGSSWRDGTITTLRLSFRGYGKKARDSVGFRVARYAE